jgi:hypothetical protein
VASRASLHATERRTTSCHNLESSPRLSARSHYTELEMGIFRKTDNGHYFYGTLLCRGTGMARSVWSRATGWTTRVRFPAGASYFYPIHSVQARSRAHPPSYTMGTGGSFSWIKLPRRYADHSHLMSRAEWWSYTSTPLLMAWCLIKHRNLHLRGGLNWHGNLDSYALQHLMYGFQYGIMQEYGLQFLFKNKSLLSSLYILFHQHYSRIIYSSRRCNNILNTAKHVWLLRKL